MVQDFARVAARIITCISCTFFARSYKNWCKIVQEKGHIACKSCMQDQVLARFLHDLASSFLVGMCGLVEVGVAIDCPKNHVVW